MCVCVCFLACGYVFACTCKHSSYLLSSTCFSRNLSVRSKCTQLNGLCHVVLCVPYSFVIRQIFGDFPRKTLNRAFEKLSFSNKFLAFSCQMSMCVCVCRSRCLGVYVPVLHVCKCNMSHVSVKSRSVYISPSQFFLIRMHSDLRRTYIAM